MPLRIVQSKQNPRLKELRRALSQPPRTGAPDALLGLEGVHLVEEALRAKLNIHAVFVAEGSEHLFNELAQQFPLLTDLETLVVPREILNAAQSTESPQPVAALVEPPDWTWAHLLGAQRNAALIVILDGLQDPGNLGTILRSAEAFGASGVIALPGTVSAWNPKAVRASAGSVFRTPILTVSAQECFRRLLEVGVKIRTTTVKGAQPADLVDLTGPVALLIGNEGNGVSDHLAAQTSGHITIPCPGPVESLNASVAASVLLYEASRQRTVLSGGPLDHRKALR